MWKDIEFTNGEYQVNKDGRVRSVDRYVEMMNRGTPYKRFFRGGELIPQKNSKGYFRVYIQGKMYFVHRLVAETFMPNHHESFDTVNHKDGNPLNNHVSNLEWCTRKMNCQHAHNIGLHANQAKGERSPFAKLKEDDVRWILDNCVKRCPTYGLKPLAKKFGVSSQTIKNIVDGKKWKHLQQ